MPKKPIVFREHQTYIPSDNFDIMKYVEEHSLKLSGVPTEYMGTPDYLAIDSNLKASYYIGATWLVKNDLPVIVLPKIPNIDYLELFVTALSVKTKQESCYFTKCYGIDFNLPPIETTENVSQLSPLLLVHYITLVEELIKHGLKKDYITITENLSNRIKGHLVISQQIKKNIIPKSENRNVCTFQIYTTDIPVNRLLKKAIVFAQKMLLNLFAENRHYSNLQLRINRIMPYFSEISDEIEISKVNDKSYSKIFSQYKQAVKVAKEILRRYDYSLSNVNKETHVTPCFWIDMSRLFELYVYSKLSDAYKDKIEFQVEGYNGTAVDFIHTGEHLIIDAKYKPRYEKSYKGIIPDIREISGYSRDYSILKHFGKDIVQNDEEVKCLIIYPQDILSDEIEKANDETTRTELNEINNMNEFLSSADSLWDQTTPIKYYRNFGKIRIPLPILV